jgi:sugar phosphate isomerase/epimerase
VIRRRDLLTAGTFGSAARLSFGARRRIKIGVTDWNLRLPAKPEALELASKLDFEGVEVSLGRKAVDNRLPLDDAGIQAQYVSTAKKLKIQMAGTCLDILHVNYLKNDKLGRKWVGDAISVTRKLNARVILLPFFGKGALETRAEMDFVADILKEFAPEAKRQGVVLGLENTCSAEDNARMLDRINSPAAGIYYDVGNSTTGGFDIIKEMRWLGAKRICQVHLKDNPHYLGDGKIDFTLVLKSIRDIGYSGFANLETNSPSNSVEADMRRNLAFIRKLMA